MKNIFNQLIFKMGISLFLLLVIVGSGIGLYGVFKYSKLVDSTLAEKIKLPARLISEGLLEYGSVSQKFKIEEITGTELIECLLIGVNEKVYYSIKPGQVGKNYQDIPEIKKYSFVLRDFQDVYYEKANKNIYVNISPISDNNNNLLGYLFIRTNAENVLNKKSNNLVITLILTGAGFIILILCIYFIFNNLMAKKINRLLEITDKIKDGDLNISIVEVKAQDEISKLERNINLLIEKLKFKVRFANEIEIGNFDFDYELSSNKDQLGKALIDMRNSLQKAAEEEKKARLADEERNWSTQGLAKFADILRQSHENIADLGYSIISNLVKYVNANQASIFLLSKKEEQGEYLELTACYAYDRRKFINKKIHVGDGLVGAVARERKTMYLTDIPDSYVEITSGLGKANPKALLIVPLLREDELLGILEIASLNELKKYQVEFVEKMGDSIASTIYNTRINETTANLLSISQEQAEQMRTQEEEMRQNVEELHSTQEEMARKQEELNKRIIDLEKELEQKNKQLDWFRSKE